jgi:hypothetical protein
MYCDDCRARFVTGAKPQQDEPQAGQDHSPQGQGVRQDEPQAGQDTPLRGQDSQSATDSQQWWDMQQDEPQAGQDTPLRGQDSQSASDSPQGRGAQQQYNDRSPYERGAQQHGQHSLHAQDIAVRYRLLGGWLMLFTCFYMLNVFSAFSSVAETVAAMREALRLGRTSEQAAHICSVISGGLLLLSAIPTAAFVVGVFLRRESFLHWFQVAGIFTALAALVNIVPAYRGIFSDIEQARRLFPAYGTAGFSEEYLQLLARDASIIAAIIETAVDVQITVLLTLYFSRSVRVRIYMGSDAYKKKALFSFRDKV